jgi:excisionase family DNA binding protein
MNKLLLTPEEAAEALSIGRTKVYELLGQGLLRSVRIGTCRRIPREALDEFVGGLADANNDAAAVYSLHDGAEVG